MLFNSTSAWAMDPCQAFRFFKSENWKTEFQISMQHYQLKSEVSTGSLQKYYLSTIDRLLDCYSKRAKTEWVKNPPRSSHLYDQLDSELQAFPIEISSTEAIYKTETMIVDKGLSKKDVEGFADAVRLYPRIPDKEKKVVSETDAELAELRAQFQTSYPREQFETDRRFWQDLHAITFEKGILAQRTPTEAMKLANDSVRGEVLPSLRKVEALINEAIRGEGLNWVWNRKNLAQHLIEEKLFETELMQINWQTFAHSAHHLRRYEKSAATWAEWYHALVQEQATFEKRIRQAIPMRESFADRFTGAAAKANIEIKGYVIERMTKDKAGFLLPEEIEEYSKLEYFRTKGVRPVIENVRYESEFLQPGFKTSESIFEMVQTIRKLYEITDKKALGEDFRGKLAYQSGNLLKELSESAYARRTHKSSLTVLKELLEEMADLRQSKKMSRGETFNLFRNALQEIEALAQVNAPDPQALSEMAQIYASAYRVKRLISLDDDFFFTRHLKTFRKLLSPYSLVAFEEEYATLKQECTPGILTRIFGSRK